jgi:hypothetical protein
MAFLLKRILSVLKSKTHPDSDKNKKHTGVWRKTVAGKIITLWAYIFNTAY